MAKYRNKQGKFASKKWLKFWLIVILLTGGFAWVKLSQFHDQTLVMQAHADELQQKLVENIKTFDTLDAQTQHAFTNVLDERKWSMDRIAYLTPAERQIIVAESGLRTTAKNKTSTCFGLGQLTLGNRIKYGKQLSINPNTVDEIEQVKIFRAYTADRYGTAEEALKFRLENNRNWY
jgi:hypothetical protein